ncbi:ubiquitin carboxyl-terminal hydrolase 34 isoform X1 [Trichogramma pretiosum]|uniref:ubiquitin carboxyl-terminal hydrolase 34 isoform X1 n=1 Tax=Trichogramma pretiosum TaxID=7493 RepID=UPI0006C93D45|nr:ubiquitin carboxyl-terminal hydrolase 34 isoform X1 [Trichogramma pretiosum]
MCDVCADFHDLLLSFDERISQEEEEVAILRSSDVEIILQYINQWAQRQCMCCYREIKNFDRFIKLIQNILLTSLQQLQEVHNKQKNAIDKKDKTSGSEGDENEKTEKDKEVAKKSQSPESSRSKLHWTHQDRERLFHLSSKIFLLNFPLYIAMKHGGAINPPAPAKDEGGFCEPHDAEVPAPLIRSVSVFCQQGGFDFMSNCFNLENTMPVGLAHSMVAVICNIKLWLNYNSVSQLFIPLRRCVMKYMCRLTDKELRTPAVRTMADFMWSALKDPIDNVVPNFDEDGLDLAFKYFTSTTLTMRLAGIAQINSHITTFNELCNTESIPDSDTVGKSLAKWLTDNNIISHIFGPNLHVEVIKQSLVVLSFMAMEGRISSADMDIMWQAAQLKHCAKPVYDLLGALVKHLAPTPALHLYSLIGKLEPKDHTEQSLFLVSALIKFIWTSSSASYASNVALERTQTTGILEVEEPSESSDGMEASSPDEEEEQQSPAPSPTEGPSPRKQARADSESDRLTTLVDTLAGANLSSSKKIESETQSKHFLSTATATKDRSKTDEPTSLSSTALHHPCKPIIRRAVNDMDKNTSDEHTSDADSDKSAAGVDDVAVHLRKKKFVPRKRKVPARILRHYPEVEEKTSVTASTSCVDALDRVKQEAIAVDQQVPLVSTAAVTSNKYILNRSVTTGNTTVASTSLVQSGDSSHDEDDSDIVGAVASGEGASTVTSDLNCLDHSNTRYLPTCLDEMLSDEEGSYSSRISNKSEKNMADFDGEESGCEEELAQLAAQHLSAIHMQNYHPQHSHPALNVRRQACRAAQAARSVRQVARIGTQFNLETVCKPGNTLLWDLLQDDKVSQLGEGLAVEAEKSLCNLLCFNVDRSIPMKFIEGCLENVANNRSVVISLRILPKLLASFQQCPNMDMSSVTTWADQELDMMKHFFNNLKTYVVTGPKGLYSHQIEVQVRLQFLSSIFSPMGSPEYFRLSLQQVDTLWQCLAQDPTCSDELFSWLLSQAKSTDQHALAIETLRHLCMRKLPSLPPETISMTGLSLFQQLCNLARLAAVHMERSLKDVDSVCIDFLWKIALRAKSTEVSMSAIQFLNSFYMSRQLTQEIEFVSQCMAHLAAASADLEVNEEASLRCIQRALLLLRTHLEAFRKKYAFHLRRWSLEGRGAGSHIASNCAERSQHLKIYVQPAGISEKTTFTLLSSDYVADLRAEVSKWWDDRHARLKEESKTLGSPTKNLTSGSTSSVLGSLLTDGPIRMITQGQELTIEYDEKTLAEIGFKDGQLVFISLGAGRGNNRPGKRDIDSPSLLPPPSKDSLPTLLLLRPPYFEQLFTLMSTLDSMKTIQEDGKEVPHAKAQVLSRRVWDTVTLLPTNPTLLQGFQKLDEASLPELLDPSNPHKLMYTLHIVESLSKTSKSPTSFTMNRRDSHNSSASSDYLTLSDGSSGAGDAGTTENSTVNESDDVSTDWSSQFVAHGGLRHLFDIFMSGCLENSDGSEWQQDCLASLLKQLCHLGVTKEKEKENHKRRLKNDKLAIQRLSKELLSLMDVKTVLPRITNILEQAARPRDPNTYKTGLFGRSQVIHYAMALLVCWVHSEPLIGDSLFSDKQSFGSTWLKQLILEDPDPAVRREVSFALYRLCLGSLESEEGVLGACIIDPTASKLIVPLLVQLLVYLPTAEAMHPPQRKTDLQGQSDDCKDMYGSACRDYFWLICRLVDSLPIDAIDEKKSSNQPGMTIDLQALASTAIESILARGYYETRHSSFEDDGLVGLLNLCCNIMAHNPPCKQTKVGQNLLERVFEFLFALPTPRAKHMPKCKSQASRSAAFDLLIELVKSAPENYKILREKLLDQHKPGMRTPFTWDYWPHDDGRSDCGYVGLTNLGATCYMASCMQHLYMMPEARAAILRADVTRANKHQLTLRELQRMFAYLFESERKAYNPRSFCRVYTMNHEPLNTGEQKDMAEFFIDLVSKLEEMTSDLKTLVKNLFCGILSNNVVSLDCEHVSKTLEEFYTVRCQVADMRNLYESLDEVTVKDTLEGDNMYTCSQCGKKVRAEKRACFKKLPRILCFNTMRYTFNMGTMLKEKVNTHFSFPLRLDMSGYMEKKLIPKHCQDEKEQKTDCEEEKQKTEETSENSTQQSTSQRDEHCQYDLIGVTVHTGTADGGHYYSFIRDRSTSNKDKWFLFNDAEVKPFDPNQIAAECFGGEMTSKTYDSVTDKFMDFSFEKSNSAYMLFYEWCQDPSSEPPLGNKEDEDGKKDESVSPIVIDAPTKMDITNSTSLSVSSIMDVEMEQEEIPEIKLSKELEEWIWQDNMHFLLDKNIFEHTYFSFMWQICSYIPTTLISIESNIMESSSELATAFFLETFIHAKEKPTMMQWIDLLTKQFNNSLVACSAFLDKIANDSWWPVQILVKCPNQMVRQMFQRLCIHVITRLRPSQTPHYTSYESEDDASTVGNQSCVTRFMRSLLVLMEQAKQHLKHLTEYFGLLYDFCRMGEEEAQFLIKAQAITTMVNFYLGHKSHEFVDSISEEEEEEEVVAISTEKLKPASLDKMITLIAVLVDKSRSENQLNLSQSDFTAVAGGKGFPFLYQQIRDNINLQQTRNIIQTLCRWNERLAIHLVNMMFQAITKHTEVCQPFFKMLTLLTDNVTPQGSQTCMTQLILGRVWEVARVAPHGALEWLALAVTRSKYAHTWVLQGMDNWLQHFLIEHQNQRVRTAAAFLLVSLVPSTPFRQGYRNAHRLGMGMNSHRELSLTQEATQILHQVYSALLRLLQPARHFTDISQHGTSKLTSYFALMTYCVVSNQEKIMFGPYLNDLWTLFHPKLSEPSIPVHHNKQALLLFWYHVSNDCPENISLILQNPHITRNIAFNYILADHEDQDVVMFNRVMLPAYYGLLRLCCQQSHQFTRQLAAHQNIQWAFKNITPHPTQYSTAVEELFKLMQLLVARHPDQTEQEEQEVAQFRRGTLTAYLQALDGRSSWATLISAFRILIETDEDRLFVVYNGGLAMSLEAFSMLHIMYHEATACHVSGDLAELIAIIVEFVRCVRQARDTPEPRNILGNCKEWPDILRKLATLLNTYNPPDMRNLAIDLLKELVMTVPNDALLILAPLLSHCHAALQESHATVPPGPYLPRRTSPPGKMPPRPVRPMVQMAVPHSQLEAAKGTDPEYDAALIEFYLPYHELIDVMCRLAINNDCFNDVLINLSAMLGFEGVPLHLALFPRLWLDVHAATHIDKKHIATLLRSNYTVDYVDAVLLDERSSLGVQAIFAFLKTFFPKLATHVLTEQTCSIIDNLVSSLISLADVVDLSNSMPRLIGDLRALDIVYSSGHDLKAPSTLQPALEILLNRCKISRELIKEGKLLPQAESPKKQQKENDLLKRRAKFPVMMDEDDEDDDYDAPLSDNSSSEMMEEFSKPSTKEVDVEASVSNTTELTAPKVLSAVESSVVDGKTDEADTNKSRSSPSGSCKNNLEEEKPSTPIATEELAKPMDQDQTDEEKKQSSNAKPDSNHETSSSSNQPSSNQQSNITPALAMLSVLESAIANLQMILQFQAKNN